MAFDPFYEQVLFYAPFDTDLLDLLEHVGTPNAAPAIDTSGTLPFSDSSGKLNGPSGDISFAWGTTQSPDFGSMTFETWFYNTLINGNTQIVWRSDTPAGSCGVSIVGDGRWQINMRGTGLATAAPVSLNTWHCISGTVTSGSGVPNMFEAYMDGVRFSSATPTNNNSGLPNVLRVGRDTTNINPVHGSARIGPIRITAAQRFSGASYTVPTLLPVWELEPAAAALDFPDSLPCVSRIDGFGMGMLAAAVRTPFEAGNTRQRRLHFQLPTTVQLAWRVDNLQFHPLFTWLNNYGYDWFNIDLSGIESSELNVFATEVTIRLISDVAVSLMRVHRQNWWIVTCTAEIRPLVVGEEVEEMFVFTEGFNEGFA